MKAFQYVFGSEPNDAEVAEFVNHKMLSLLDQVVRTAEVQKKTERRINPKRMARLVAREMQNKGISSKAQEALKLELDHRKKECKHASRLKREEIKEKKRAIRVQKAKEKHRGK
ncbi:YjdF family protein [Aneurinibacillus uraniidurans]|uniref:YjdF family protein n=1 Tax=Aneurinibacillus uraniidurans TaxID=2966586 RepID=UPI0023496B60|nr:YjdF family protein [Aneurinibacillus sp. B1]WCN39772.1 YjdF family protein [Aneurinibacillus sp. B1]